MRRAVSVILALLVAGLIAVGWYGYQKGFTKKWRAFAASEFRKRGVEVSIRQLALEPFRGIVARDLKIYDSRERKQTLAVVDEMLLVVNFANLLKGQAFLDALDLRDATLAIPLDAKNARGPAIEVSKLSGRLLLPPKQLYLSRLDAELYGVHLSASGRLINPQAFRTKGGDGSRTMALVERVIAELKALKLGTEPPRLDLRFNGDLAEPKSLSVCGSLTAGKVERGGYRLSSLRVEGTYREGAIELQQLAASDGRGTLAGSGNVQLASGEASLRLRSTLDAAALVRSLGLGGPMEDFALAGPPLLELTAHANLGTAFSSRLLAHVGLQSFTFRSLPFESLAADVSWQDGKWSAREVRLVHRTGELTGDAILVPGDFHAQLHSTINPRVLAPFLTGKTADVFSQFNFLDAPALDIEVRGAEPKLDACKATAELKMGRAIFRNSAAESLVATVHWGDRKLAIEPFRLRRVEGGGTGGVTVDFARDEVHLDKIHANVNPAEVIVWFAPDILKDVAPYRFVRRPPNVFVNGLVHTKHGKSTHLVIDVDAPSGMDYTFLKKNLSSPQVSAKLLFTDQRLKISDLSASLYGGRLRGNADISIIKEKPGHIVELQAENVDFASVTKLYFNYGESKGRMSGVYNFTGRGDDPHTMRGRGEISLSDGNVFAIPFLGPFSGILNSIVPGLGQDVAHKASAAFTISDGVIATDKLLVEGKGFSMIGDGKLMFLDDAMDFDMRINARGLPGVVLYPVSKLFEYVADEKLSKPKWRLKALPRL